MHRQKVISKGKYLYSQKIGAVTVDSYVVFEENGNKFLLLRLLNGRAETLDGLTLKVTQYDAAGKAISSEHYCFDGKEYGANSRFVPDKKIPLGKDCAEFRANVLSATYGNYRYIASAEGVAVDYVPKKQQNAFDTSDKLKGMKGQRLAVKSSKLRMSLVLGLFAIVMTAGICALGFFNLDYFKETATGFMKDGVEYRFIDGDKSSNGKLAVAGYSGTSGAVNIPSVIKGYPVISVDSRAFMNNDGITYVSFGGDITIEDEAFCNCTSLNFVDFEDVVFVGDNAFNNCTNLLELNSQTLSHIGLNAFSGCYSLMGVEIGGEGSVYIGERAFSGCGNLSSVTIDKNIEFEYSDGVFSACDSLESLSFANFYATELTVAELFGSGVCPLRELKIGELNALNDGFCKGMDALESVEILKLSDEKVGDYAFADCTNLRDVSLGGEIFEVGNYAFENCRKLSDFTISDDVFRIGDYAFSECTNLRLSYLPESLTEIGQFAFSGCGNVSISSIPDGVTSIGDYAFSNCYSITSLTIPDSVLSMGLGMLEGCNLLESLTTPFVGRTRDDNSFIAYTFGIFDAAATNIPYSLASVTLTDSKFIPDYAFANCSDISEIIIDCPISYIGSSAFSGCGGLSSLELSAGLEEIGQYAFANCYSLESLEIPDSVKTIGLGALSGCSSLNSLTTPFVGLSRDGNAFLAYMFGSMNINSGYMVPDSLKTVEVTDSDVLSESAFYGCSFIKSIVLGDGMTQIGRCAFSGCNALTDIVVPDTVTSFGDEAFRGCNSLHSIELPLLLTEIGAYMFDGCVNLSAVELSPNLVSIGEYAFADCSSLEMMEIPQSVQYIGFSVFSGCNSLNSLTTPFVGFSRDENAFLSYMFGSMDSYSGYVVPYLLKTVEVTDSDVLGDSAFYGCSNIKSVTLCDGMTQIGRGAFSGCNALTDIVIPDTVTSVGDNAFNWCNSLRSIELPQQLAEIGAYVFDSCLNLSTVELSPDLASIGEYAFANCSSLESLEIPDSVNTIGLGALSGCSSLNSLTTPFVGYSRDSNAFIAYMFGGTDMYTSYYIPYSLESVEITDSYFLGECAFYGCNDIKTVTLNEEIESIGTSAFSGCGSLVSLQIPKNVTRIGDSAFYGCYELTTIEFPDGVTDLGDQVLYDCIKLTSLKLPENLASIGEYAFANCSSLESLEIPDSVNTIGLGALSGCSSLNSLTTPFVGYSRNQNAFLAYMFGGTEIYSNYMVPETLTAVEITDSDAIAAGAFNNCYRIESITLNEGITAIENNAFYGCVSLESIELPESVTSVGMNAFGSCNYLRSIRLPSTLLTIDDNAFSNCYRLYSVFNDSSLNLTCGMSDYGNVAQYACKIYSYGEEAQVAEENGYEFCHFDDGWYVVAVPDDLVSADLPSSFAFDGAIIDEYKIPHYLFYHEEVLEGVYIPDSVRSIGEQAFSNCNSLIRAEFSQTSPVTEIPFQAFAYSNKLTELVLPSGLETIGDMAFINCISLKDFTVGAEISQIGNEAFNYCYRLLEIYNYSQLGIVAGSTDYGYIARYAMAVYGADGESEVEFVTVDGLEFAVRGGEWYLVGCDDGISELRLEAFDYEGQHIDSFSVYPYAFIQNMQLTSVYIGDAVTSIGESAFSNCTNLTEVVFDNTRITRIEDAAFEYCYSLVTLVLPENVQEIGENAFRNNMIAELELPDSLRVIEDYAFTNTYITQLELPSSVQSLGNYAFAYCYELVVVTVNSDVDIGQDAFMGDDIKIVNNFSNLEIVAGDWNNGGIAINAIYVNTDPSEETYVHKTDGYTFAFIEGQWVLIDYSGYYQTVTIPESFVFEDNEVSSFAIAGGAFRYATIAYLVIPESVSSIAEGAFYMCNITYVCYKGTAEEWEQIYAEGCGLESVTVLYYADCVHDTGSWTYDGYGNLVTGVYYHSEITKEATCNEEGEMSDVCDVCGEVIRTYPYDKLPHSPDSDGVCAVCGAQGEVVGAGGYLPSYITDDALYPFAVGTDGTLTMTGTAPGSSSTLILTAEKDMEVYISMNLSSEIYAEIQIEGAGYGYGAGYYTNQFTLKEGEQLTLNCSVNFFAQSDGEMSFSIILFEI